MEENKKNLCIHLFILEEGKRRRKRYRVHISSSFSPRNKGKGEGGRKMKKGLIF